MNKLVALILVVSIAGAIHWLYKSQFVEVRQAYQAMSEEVTQAIKEQEESQVSRELLERRSRSFNSALVVFRQKARSRDQSLVRQLDHAYQYLNSAFEKFPNAPPSPKEVNETIRAAISTMDIKFSVDNDGRLLAKTRATLPKYTKSQELALKQVVDELENFSRVCAGILPELQKGP